MFAPFALHACSGAAAAPSPSVAALSTHSVVVSASPTPLSSPRPKATGTPPATPAPSGTAVASVSAPTGSVRNHTLSVEFGSDSAQAINATYGFNNWQVAAQYIDLDMSPGNAVNNAAIRAGGIKTGLYLDPNLCSGSYAIGPNSGAAPNCAPLPDDAFYSESGTPANALTVSYNGQIVQKWSNPASPALQAAALSAVQGYMSSEGDFDVIEIDDATTPAEYGGTMCWGFGTVTSSGYSCSGAPGGAASAPFGSVYSRSQWQQGEAQLGASMPRPVVYDGLGGNPQVESASASAGVAASAGNAWGGMCDTCFYATQANAWNKWLWTSPVLDDILNGYMQVIGAGRNAIVVNEDMSDTATRTRALADIMLAYDPDHLYLANLPCGNVSHIHACAEQGLTFYSPLKPYPASVANVRSSSGLYIREFGACYDHGTAIGPCATVVNPDPYNAHPLTGLVNSYEHTIVVSGTGPCNCYGDSGAVAFNGPAAPASVPAASAYIVVP